MKEISNEVESMPIVEKDEDSEGEGEESDSSSEGEPEIVNNDDLMKVLKEIEMSGSDSEDRLESEL